MENHHQQVSAGREEELQEVYSEAISISCESCENRKLLSLLTLFVIDRSSFIHTSCSQTYCDSCRVQLLLWNNTSKYCFEFSLSYFQINQLPACKLHDNSNLPVTEAITRRFLVKKHKSVCNRFSPSDSRQSPATRCQLVSRRVRWFNRVVQMKHSPWSFWCVDAVSNRPEIRL